MISKAIPAGKIALRAEIDRKGRSGIVVDAVSDLSYGAIKSFVLIQKDFVFTIMIGFIFKISNFTIGCINYNVHETESVMLHTHTLRLTERREYRASLADGRIDESHFIRGQFQHAVIRAVFNDVFHVRDEILLNVAGHMVLIILVIRPHHNADRIVVQIHCLPIQIRHIRTVIPFL